MKIIKVLRMSQGLTQNEVAKKAAITRGWYSLIESGRLQPSKKTTETLERVFGLPADELLRDIKLPARKAQ
ncbi:MAG: Helix-turn-helix domain protein [Pelotomaculum sp. PtaB.Bin104]|nr:MAG: Helix-turn-helix domain protein [Pelotomaculum sp. PtaB.Bin104]